MKAREYAEMYKSAPTDDTVAKICIGFMAEVRQLIKARHLQNDYGLVAVFDEQDRKWRALVRLVDGQLRADGFSIMVKALLPEPYAFWQQQNALKRKIRHD